mmetsp:Transcript_9926/g.34606  ORF Transcript_9926/g.34606 Transcript_9926/m.34606 type:complete len:351 (+) Transcript_9926:96-1148(+)|eukprot:CAMPEP_0183789692 /NCGR_PEP_ID=MMETSP0803_2-20130417/567_1 /TAXON_ID=195967 /ORGANISM="Crustomastix stigmata, Strain CCMP3273" /LENGTH=350 /DNA_ID=CAMNT_0026033869 /DNA_START=96 /DNA_END=1148 /DNA_ORIENTATION=+
MRAFHRCTAESVSRKSTAKRHKRRTLLTSTRSVKDQSSDISVKGTVPVWAFSGTLGKGNAAEVKDIVGVEVVRSPDESPLVVYRVKWKDSELADSWEPASNIAQDLIVEYENSWWEACRASDDGHIATLLSGGGRVLVFSVDDKGRSGLHYAAGVGSVQVVQLLLDAGAKVDCADKDGYTPLHIAAGYMHAEIVNLLLNAGADAELEDNSGRSPLGLINNLLSQTSTDPMFLSRRALLEDVAKSLENAVFEELEPRSILESRTVDGEVRFLVDWYDQAQPQWLSEAAVADDVVDDFKSGLEYAEAAAVISKRVTSDGRIEYLTTWQDEAAPSWELKGNIVPHLWNTHEGS